MSETAQKRPQRPGRIRQAYLALMGHPVVPDAIRAEWVAWQLELEAVCDKISAAAARMQTRNKRELDRAVAELDELKAREAADPFAAYSGPGGPAGSYPMAKRALNRLVLQRQGVNLPAPPNGASHVPGDEAE